MASLGEVRDRLVALATTAVYPLGTSSPSVTGKEVIIGAGWPLPKDIDTAMSAGYSIVSVWPVPGGAGAAEQLFEQPYVVKQPVIGMSVALGTSTITLSGTPNVGEYATSSIDNQYTFSVTALAGATAASMATQLAAAIAVQYPGTSAIGGVITVVGSHLVECGLGAVGTVSQMVWRQKQMIRVVIRSPSDVDRNTLENAIDPLFKSTNRLTFPDQSQGFLFFYVVIENDTSERVGEYQRTLIYTVTYSTGYQYPAYPIITVGTENITPPLTVTRQT